MLCGVSFTRDAYNNTVVPGYVNQYVLTDIYLSTISTPTLRRAPLPSIATLVNPFASLLRICISIFRAFLFALLSRLPGSEQAVKKISVANTAILYHDGRALATCESGPPMRVSLPSLETIGWYNGKKADGEPQEVEKGPKIGGTGPLSWMREWITAHPKVDPETNEMLFFNSMFLPPYVHYSIVPAEQDVKPCATAPARLLNAPVSGVSSAKMMHDFGVSHNHTVIMDLPLSLDPTNLIKNKPSIMYDPSRPSRFGVFPRREPDNVRWFETDACCIFHTANTWDVTNPHTETVDSVDMLACRMISADVVFSGGNVSAPKAPRKTAKKVATAQAKRGRGLSKKFDPAYYEKSPLLDYSPPELKPLLLKTNLEDASSDDDLYCPGPQAIENAQDRLYYYSFSLNSPPWQNSIRWQFALSKVHFDFPSVAPGKEMSSARYVYGCTSTRHTFNTSLGLGAKMDCLVKFDVQTLIVLGKAQDPPIGPYSALDTRDAEDVLHEQRQREERDEEPEGDTIQVFQAPKGIYLQEPRFVPSSSYDPSLNGCDEDAGFLLTYVFDETQLLPSGEAAPDAASELWIIDAKNMRDVLAKVKLPQRVPYGFHAGWFTEEMIRKQRPWSERRAVKGISEGKKGVAQKIGRWVIDQTIWAIGG